jgi:hypothetical protein
MMTKEAWKSDCIMATWNVRIMSVPGKMQEINGRKTVGQRRGRLLLRWMDDVVADLKVMKIKQWIDKTKDRNGD